jgi:hypothetical protein
MRQTEIIKFAVIDKARAAAFLATTNTIGLTGQTIAAKTGGVFCHGQLRNKE